MDTNFSHRSLSLKNNKKLVYTALSKHFFYYRMHISKYVLEKGAVPLNPFLLFDYFLIDSVDRDLVREANNSIVKKADEIWVFGPVSNGVLAEILIAKKENKPILFFKIEKPHSFQLISSSKVEMEEDVKSFSELL